MPDHSVLHIALLADHSVQRLGKLVEKELAKQGVQALCQLGEGDDGLSEGMDDDSPLYANAPAIGWISISTAAFREKFYSARDEGQRAGVADALIAQLDALVGRLHKRQMRVFITTLSAPVERMFGHLSPGIESSLTAQVRRVNRHLHERSTGETGFLLIDVEHLAAMTGLAGWYDERMWYHAKYPCHARNLGQIASAFASVLLAARGRVTKCLVLDLDNTLWGGVIGDDGLDGIVLGGVGQGEAFRDFQRYLRTLRERGIILCICSKNEEVNALLPFREHDAMVLKETDIALFAANWRPKSENISWIATTLNIGLDSIAFVDDSPFEREEVRRALPMVQVPDLPEDPAHYAAALEQAGLFEATAGQTPEDAMRTSLYRAEGDRRKLQEGTATADDYLASLNIIGTFRPVTGQHLQRAAQLIARSNQFNLRTQRVSQEQLAAWMTDAGRPCFCVDLQDRFGDYGMIAVLCCAIEDRQLFVHELVMSCRVLARGVEHFIVNSLAATARRLGLQHIVGEYIPTAKNSLVAGLYPRLGFQPLPGEGERWCLSLENWQPLPTHVHGPAIA